MNLTQEILKELIHYNPNTGIFIWNFRERKWFKTELAFKTWNTRYCNKIVGSKIENNWGNLYKRTSIFKIEYKLHRLAFLYMTGKFPKNQVDHEDGNGLNNKWENLKEVDNQENSKNCKIKSNNTTGYTGIDWTNRNRYRARIKDTSGKEIHLGYFRNLSEAIEVRNLAEIKYGYHKNHGKRLK